MPGRRTLPLPKGASPAHVHGRPTSLLAVMDPVDFTRLTTNGGEGVRHMLDSVGDGSALHAGGGDGRFAMPHLVVDAAPGRILEHDGRHRCALVARARGRKVPVAMRFRDGGTWVLTWVESGDSPTYVATREESFPAREAALARKGRPERGQGGPEGTSCWMFDLVHAGGGWAGGTSLPETLTGQFDPAISMGTRGIPAVRVTPGEGNARGSRRSPCRSCRPG